MDERRSVMLYVPKDYEDKCIVERLEKLAEQRDRSLNYMLLQATLEYLERHEASSASPE